MNIHLNPQDHRMLKIEAIERGETLCDLASKIMNEGVNKLRLERESRQRKETEVVKGDFEASTNLVIGETSPQ